MTDALRSHREFNPGNGQVSKAVGLLGIGQEQTAVVISRPVSQINIK